MYKRYEKWLGLMAPAMTLAGIVLVPVSYRLSPAHKYPEPMEDCMAALAWVRRNIADRGGTLTGWRSVAIRQATT